MSFFGNIGNAIKKGVVDTGHFVGKVASNPVVEGLAGATLGPAGAALVGGLGHAMAPGGNLISGIKGAATGYAAGQVGSHVGDAFRSGGVFGAGKAAASNAASGFVPFEGVKKAPVTSGGYTMQPDGSWSQSPTDMSNGNNGESWFGKLGGMAHDAVNGTVGNGKGGVDWGKVAKLGTAGASLYGQHQQSSVQNKAYDQATQRNNDALTKANADYAARQPIRDAAYANLAKLGSNRSSDVFRPLINSEMGSK